MGYPVKLVRDFCIQIWEKAGLLPADAASCTDTLLTAEFRGVRTHGVTHMKDYCKRLRLGTMTNGADIEFAQTSPSTLLVDAKYAVGMVAANKIMDRCIAQAQLSGVCFAAVHKGSHYGIGAHYPLKASAQNMIGFSFANTSPLVAPFGGADPILGTNPISVAVPAGKYPDMVVDMATSLVAKGKISLALKEGQTIPKGWALDKNGAPTTDPAAADVGALMPFGGHKGYGIGLVVSLLSFALSGADMDLNLPKFFDRPELLSNGGYFMGAIDISRFCPIEEFKTRVDTFFDILKSSRPAVGSQGVLIPGELEVRLSEKTQAEGIELSAATLSDFKEMAEIYGVDYPF